MHGIYKYAGRSHSVRDVAVLSGQRTPAKNRRRSTACLTYIYPCIMLFTEGFYLSISGHTTLINKAWKSCVWKQHPSVYTKAKRAVERRPFLARFLTSLEGLRRETERERPACLSYMPAGASLKKIKKCLTFVSLCAKVVKCHYCGVVSPALFLCI